MSKWQKGRKAQRDETPLSEFAMHAVMNQCPSSQDIQVNALFVASQSEALFEDSHYVFEIMSRACFFHLLLDNNLQSAMFLFHS